MDDKRIRLCPHCRKPVIPSEIRPYVWQCLECDEDFFDIECYKNVEINEAQE